MCIVNPPRAMLVAVAAAAPALLLTPTVGCARGRPSLVTLRNRHPIVQAVESMPAANTGDTNGATKCTGEEHAAMTSIGGDFASKYGEITGRGFTSLAERLRLGPNDVFVDCGSGLGVSVSQAAREFGVRRSYGVEFSTSRHELAVERLAADAIPLSEYQVVTIGDIMSMVDDYLADIRYTIECKLLTD